jgi:hypothetical protein
MGRLAAFGMGKFCPGINNQIYTRVKLNIPPHAYPEHVLRKRALCAFSALFSDRYQSKNKAP